MIGPQNENLSKERLEELYVNSDRSLSDVAKEIGSHRETVRRWVLHYGLPLKSKARKGPRKDETQSLGDKKWLGEQLESKSANQIAKDLGTTVHNVWYWSKKHDLQYDADKSSAVKAGLAKAFPEGRGGENAGNWKGGRKQANSSGYIHIHIPDHPHATKQGYVMEHRLVMEKELGRHLDPGEIVHHKNGIKDDNRLENLEVLTRSDHVTKHFDALAGLHEAEDRIAELEKENRMLKAKLAHYES